MPNSLLSQGPAEALRWVPNADLRVLRPSVHFVQRASDTEILFEGVRRLVTQRDGTSAIGGEARPETSDLLRTQQREARFCPGPRMADSGVRPRRLHLSGVRSGRRAIECRPHQAIRAISRLALRCEQRPDAMRGLPSQDPHVWVARVLVEAPGLEIAGQAVEPRGTRAVNYTRADVTK